MTAGDTESKFELDFLSWLDESGWKTHSASEFGVEHSRRSSKVFYGDIAKESLVELNDCVTPSDADAIIDDFKDRFRTQDGLVSANKTLHSALRRGIDVEVPSIGSSRTVNIVDLETPENNRFDALQQFQFEQERTRVVPDIVLLVNGIPLVISELKASNRGKTSEEAISDLQTYEDEAPRLFYPVLFNIAATRQEFRYGAVGASDTHYNAWRPEDRRPAEPPGQTGYDVESVVKSLCTPERLLEIVREFVFFDDSGPHVSKIVPRHPQYFGAKAIERRYNTARSRNLPTEETPVTGLIWHTQGSGKSYTMYYAARRVVRETDQMAILLVDTLNLKEQFGRELRQLTPGFGDNVIVPGNKQELRTKLREEPNKIILTNIHLFDGIDEALCDDEAFLFSDEAHRYMEKDFGAHIDAALPNLNHFGFTGTPVQGSKLDTFSHFAMDGFDTEDQPFLHRYSMLRAVQEGVIVPVDIVNRTEAINWDIDKKEIDASLLSKYGFQRSDDLNELVSKHLTSREVAELPSRADVLAADIADHFDTYVESSTGANKAMVVTASREAASLLGERLQSELGEDDVRVLYTAQKDDSDQLRQFHTDAGERETIQTDFKNKESPTVLVVCDMLLTGFDAPVLRTIFLDRNLGGHTLMQAIARANRPMDEKPFGEIVDYWGVYDGVQEMYDSMSDEIDLYVSSDKDDFINRFEDKLSLLQSLCEAPPDQIGDTEKDAERLVTTGQSEKFLDEFKHLRDLREAIQPDQRMLDYDEAYQRIDNVYFQIRAIETKDDPIDRDQFIRNAKESIESGATVTRKSITPSDAFTVEEWMSEDLKVHRIYHGVEDVLSKRQEQTPAYADLSERVEEIITGWNQEIISSEEALDKFEQIESEFEDRPQPEEMGRRDWFEQVVVDVLIDETPEDVEVDEGLVETIVDTFSSNWDSTRKMSTSARRQKLTTEVRKSLLYYGTEGQVLAKELAKTDFSHKVCGYLIRNTDIRD